MFPTVPRKLSSSIVNFPFARRPPLELFLIFQDDVEGVHDAGNVTEDCEEDVDAEVGTAATLEENSEGREDDRNDDLADVASGERHFGGCVVNAIGK